MSTRIFLQPENSQNSQLIKGTVWKKKTKDKVNLKILSSFTSALEQN